MVNVENTRVSWILWGLFPTIPLPLGVKFCQFPSWVRCERGVHTAISTSMGTHLWPYFEGLKPASLYGFGVFPGSGETP